MLMVGVARIGACSGNTGKSGDRDRIGLSKGEAVGKGAAKSIGSSSGVQFRSNKHCPFPLDCVATLESGSKKSKSFPFPFEAQGEGESLRDGSLRAVESADVLEFIMELSNFAPSFDSFMISLHVWRLGSRGG